MAFGFVAGAGPRAHAILYYLNLPWPRDRRWSDGGAAHGTAMVGPAEPRQGAVRIMRHTLPAPAASWPHLERLPGTTADGPYKGELAQ